MPISDSYQDDEITLPPTVDLLLKFLDEHFPEKSPLPGTSADRIWFDAGKREVVRFLLALRDRRDENILA